MDTLTVLPDSPQTETKTAAGGTADRAWEDKENSECTCRREHKDLPTPLKSRHGEPGNQTACHGADFDGVRPVQTGKRGKAARQPFTDITSLMGLAALAPDRLLTVDGLDSSSSVDAASAKAAASCKAAGRRGLSRPPAVAAGSVRRMR